MSDSLQRPSRRAFLKSSSAALAGTALAGSLGSRSYAAASDTVKVALVGCGGRGTGAAAQALAVSSPTKLIAMADVFEDALESSLQRLMKATGSADESAESKIDVPKERRFVGLDAYKQAIDAGADMVILATPPGFRPAQFEYAVQQGKNVFMEKPVAVDAPGVRRVLAATQEAKKKNLKVGVGLQRHHQLMYQETINRIHDGAIGDVVFMRTYWNGGGVWDPRLARENARSEMEYQIRNWYYYNWLCGDHIVEQHIHNLDVGNWIKGKYPATAQGQGGRQVRVDPKYGEIFDHHFVEFTYDDGSVMLSQCRHIKNCWNSVSEYAHGTKGKATVSGGIIEPHEGEGYRFREKAPNPYQVEHDVLSDAIRNNTTFNEGENGALASLTAIMGRMATYGGKVVRWQDALESQIDTFPPKLAWDAPPPTLPDSEGRYPIPVPGITQAF